MTATTTSTSASASARQATSGASTAVHVPRLGRPGETCRGCSAPLATDQRYCLNCGARRVDAPLRFLDEPGTAAAVGAADGLPGAAAGGPPPLPPAPSFVGAALPPAAAGPAVPEQRALTIVAAVATMLLALGVGVLIGNAGGGEAPRPTVVSVGAAGAAVPAAAVAAPFTGDWPAGTSGFAIQLQLLPKASTTPAQVAEAKAAATGKGVPAAGALDTDAYPSLPPGSYLVYSGVYDSRKPAQEALAAVTGSYPDAKVVEVSTTAGRAEGAQSDSADEDTGTEDAAAEPDPDATTLSDDALENKENASPESFQKQSKKLPDEVQSDGAAPPTDDKPAGGGGEAETFG